MTAAIPALYTREQVAARWGLSTEWLRRQAIARTIPFTRIAGRNLFSDDDVRAILAMHAVKPQNSRPAASPVPAAPAGRPKRSAVA